MTQLTVALLKFYEQVLVKRSPLRAPFKSSYQLEMKMELESGRPDMFYGGTLPLAGRGWHFSHSPVEWMSKLSVAKARKVKPEGGE